MTTEANTELSESEVAEIEALSAKVPDGPWFADADIADDVPDHRRSGLALVDTGRSGDWWIARLCEWHIANFIAASKTNVDALCATVKALRAQMAHMQSKTHFLTCGARISALEDRLAEVEEEKTLLEIENKSIKELAEFANETYRKQAEEIVDEFRSQLEEVERERDAEKKDHQLTINTFRRQEQIWQQKHDDFINNALELCKAKAEEWQSLFDSDCSGEHDEKMYYVAATNILITELETLK